MRYGFVLNDRNEVIAAFHGKQQNFHMAAHAFMMAGYGVMHVSAEEYKIKKQKNDWQ